MHPNTQPVNTITHHLLVVCPVAPLETHSAAPTSSCPLTTNCSHFLFVSKINDNEKRLERRRLSNWEKTSQRAYLPVKEAMSSLWVVMTGHRNCSGCSEEKMWLCVALQGVKDEMFKPWNRSLDVFQSSCFRNHQAPTLLQEQAADGGTRLRSAKTCKTRTAHTFSQIHNERKNTNMDENQQPYTWKKTKMPTRLESSSRHAEECSGHV
ncbi:unnamed protein product [Pleuronectes platessa]|uniref:Uncharacterized protein n=1 Tax=Pleuronectes platessa TaxID=8262 RepID=A0A9N7YQ67_PLEPL|nr:unnamed protein product [Pleuronectes platessa]